ncbi:MAG: glycosyltransferase [Candidatus Eisenbacteria bacterium]|nr:glycosyltransferase [Candidatus Eisenbacteria bacterium]
MDGRSVSVVIPAWNAAGRVGRAVRASLAQDGISPAPEVVVVDDGSSDRTAEEAEGAGARVVCQENRGPAAARNAGWRAAGGETILFTDADCIPCADWAARLVNLLGEERAGAAGGSYDIANPESLLARCVQEEIALRHRRMKRNVRFLGSYNLAVRRRVLEETGGFDESYRRASGEDNDLSYRIRKRGYRLLFDPEARVRHVHPERLGRYLLEQARHGYWRMKLYRDHPERMRGDDYSGLVDFLEPPAALAAVLLLPFARTAPARLAAAIALLFLLLAALGATVRMARRGGPSLLFFFPVRLARAFARGGGLAAGVWSFWIAAALRGETR